MVEKAEHTSASALEHNRRRRLALTMGAPDPATRATRVIPEFWPLDASQGSGCSELPDYQRCEQRVMFQALLRCQQIFRRTNRLA
jgi:hypothetical protein